MLEIRQVVAFVGRRSTLSGPSRAMAKAIVSVAMRATARVPPKG